MIDWLRRDESERTIDLGGFAVPIAIRRHPRAKRMTLRLAPDGAEVRLTIPRWGSTREALAFAESRRDWLAAQRAKVPARAPVGDGATLAFRGEALLLRHDPMAPRRPAIAMGSLTVGGPADTLPARVRRWLEGEASRLVEADLAHYCAAARIAAPALRLSRAQRRWGSCSSGGVVRINWRLVQAPDAVRRSVVAHEVAHLVHFDHSPAFHALLGELYKGDLRAADRWLKDRGRSLYATFG